MTAFVYVSISFLVACLASLCLFIYAKREVREGRNNHEVILASASAPFLALGWIVIALFIHVAISNGLAHQDCGFSPDPYVTLPNGYVLGSANTYDGYFVAPGFKTDVPVASPGYVRSLIDLKYSGDLFTGTQFDLKTSEVRNFVFNTRTHSFQAFEEHEIAGVEGATSVDQGKWGAAEARAHNDIDSYWVLYAQYRHEWPDYLLALLILTGESAIAFRLWQKWRRAPVLQT